MSGTSYGGFQTGHGKPVQVSKEALAKTKSFFNDLNFPDTKQKKVGDGESRATAKEGSEEDEYMLKSFEAQRNLTANSSMSYGGFQTAGGKAVQVSEKALLKGKSIFGDALNLQPGHQKDVRPNVREPSTISAKTQTASNISADTINSISAEVKNKFAGQSGSSSSAFGGFQTAGGKAVQISAQALAKGKSLLGDTLNLNDHKYIKTSSLDTKYVSKTESSLPEVEKLRASDSSPSLFKGFQTAGGKAVKISDDALAKGKSLLAETLNLNSDNQKSLNAVGLGRKPVSGVKSSFSEGQNKVFSGSSASLASGFQTAGGKAVPVSEATLAKGKSFFGDILNLNSAAQHNNQINAQELLRTPTKGLSKREAASSKNSNVESSALFGGFQTAGGKQVQISEGALAKGKRIFDDTSNSNNQKFFKTSTHDLSNKSNFFSDSSIKAKSTFDDEFKGASWEKSFNNEQHFNASGAGNSSRSLSKTPNNSTASLDRVFSLFNSQDDVADENNDDEDDEEPELSPIINFRQPRLPESIYHNRNNDSDADEISCARKIFFESPIKQTSSTPILRCSPRRGKKLSYHEREFDQDEFESQDQYVFTPSPKRTKFGYDMNEEIPYGFTQEVRDLAEDCIADDEKSRLLLEDDSSFDCRTLISTLVDPVVLIARENSRLAQMTEMKEKRQNIVKAVEGSLKKFRNSNQNNRVQFGSHPCLTSLTQWTETELLAYGVKKSVLSITSQNALGFRFDGADFFGEKETITNRNGFVCGDDVVLVLGHDCAVGVKEVSNAFMCSPGVDPKLISQEWVCNHYKWIVWTLSNYEIKFPTEFAGRALTPDNVLLRLKYRYDREIDKSERSALHRIIEQDDTPAKRMILLVSKIMVGEMTDLGIDSCGSDNTNPKINTSLELTDGWYSIECACDSPFLSFIEKGLISVGTKLCLHGAELIASEPCHPLEAKGKVMMKFGSNAVRRAKWNSRLGFCSNPTAFPVALSSVITDGGQIPLIHAIVARAYPILYHCKSDGKSVFFSEKYFEKLRQSKETQREHELETIYSRIRKEVQENLVNTKTRQSRRMSFTSFSKDQLEGMTVEELLDLMEYANDVKSLETKLSKSKLDQLNNGRLEREDKIRISIQNKFEKEAANINKDSELNPVPLLKIRLVGANINEDTLTEVQNHALLSIWRPREELLQLLTENSVLKIFSLVPAKMSHSSTEKRITATKFTKYLPLLSSPNCGVLDKLKRQCYSIESILQEDFNPMFNEFDVVGLVVYISPPLPNSGQTVYLADHEKNILGVRLWFPISSQGLEEILCIPQFVAISNLNWRASSPKNCIPTAFSQETTHFACHPRDSRLSRELLELKSKVTQEARTFAESCEMVVYRRLGSSSKFSSTPKSALPLPVVVEKKGNTSKTDLLENYANPPPLPEMQMRHSTKVTKKFQVPRRIINTDNSIPNTS